MNPSLKNILTSAAVVAALAGGTAVAQPAETRSDTPKSQPDHGDMMGGKMEDKQEMMQTMNEMMKRCSDMMARMHSEDAEQDAS